MKKTRIALLLAIALLAGCQTNQTIVKNMTQSAINYGKVAQGLELAKCADPNDCPKADKIGQWIARGELLYSILINEKPESYCQAIDDGFTLILADMNNQDESSENIALVIVLQGMVKSEVCR